MFLCEIFKLYNERITHIMAQFVVLLSNISNVSLSILSFHWKSVIHKQYTNLKMEFVSNCTFQDRCTSPNHVLNHEMFFNYISINLQLSQTTKLPKISR